MAKKKRKCVKGKACGNSCISKAKSCRVESLNESISNSINKTISNIGKSPEKPKTETKKPNQKNEKRTYNEYGIDKERLKREAEENGWKFSSEVKSGGNIDSITITKRVSENSEVSIEYVTNNTKPPSISMNFQVNGKYDVDESLSRRDKFSSAKEIKKGTDLMNSNVQDGTELIAIPYDEDGKGEMRTRAYEKLGFTGNIFMTAKMENGKIVPSNDSNTDLFFEELNLNDSEKIWYQAIFGEEI